MRQRRDRTGEASARPGYLLVVPWDLDAIGGVVQVVKNLYRELDATGWTPTILITTWGAAAPRDDSTPDHRILLWRVRGPVVPDRFVRGFIAYLAALPSTAWTWRRLAHRHRWRVVNFHFPGFAVLTWILMKRLGLWDGLIVLSVHGLDVRRMMVPGRRWRRRLMRLILEHADAIVGCSAELSDDVAALAPRAKGRISVIHNGVNAALLRAQSSGRFRLADKLSMRRFILNVAKFEHKKAQDVLIDAFERLAPSFADVDLVLAGRSTPWLEDLRRRAAAGPAGARIHFLADLEHAEVADLLARASIFCLPSRSEGHPVTVLEAAVFARPVVASAVGGVCQTIAHERDGLLVPAEDATALSSALGRLLANPALGETLGRSLQRRVETEFTWERAARRYTELTAELKRGPSARLHRLDS